MLPDKPGLYVGLFASPFGSGVTETPEHVFFWRYIKGNKDTYDNDKILEESYCVLSSNETGYRISDEAILKDYMLVEYYPVELTPKYYELLNNYRNNRGESND